MTDLSRPDIITFKNLKICYGERVVLDEVNFQLMRGEFTYLIGRTGSGKSSLLRVLYADLKPAQGTALVGKYDLRTIKSKEVPFLRRSLGIVFQDFQLLPDRSIGENLSFVMKATGWNDAKKIKQRIADSLMMVGLSNKTNLKPHELSGGEQQRTAIARALVNDPILLVADEPTGNLDPEVTGNIMDILFKINLSGTAVLMATHEHTLIEKYPARVIECKDGRLIEKPEFARANPIIY